MAQSFDQTQKLGVSVAQEDLGPLAWVLDEVKTSVSVASKALKQFAGDVSVASATDMASLDDTQLRLASQQLHQAMGALTMVGLEKPSKLLQQMNKAIQRFLDKPELCNVEAASTLEKAGYSLTFYLESYLAGRKVSAIALFPQYADVSALADDKTVHPSQLWEQDWKWFDVKAAASVEPKPINAETRKPLDKWVLSVVRGFDVEAATNLRDTSLAISAGQLPRQTIAFWRLAAGYFDAIAQELLVENRYTKRAASQVLMQFVKQVKQPDHASPDLAHELLFHCAQSPTPDASSALGKVREAYGLQAHVPLDYETEHFGQVDPATVARSRKYIANVKETWSLVSGGDLNRADQISMQFSKLGQSLKELLPNGEGLANVLQQCADQVAQTKKAPQTTLALEVATAILYVEAVLEDFDLNDPTLSERTGRLTERIVAAQQGGSAEPLEPWMEDLYRKVSDKQNIGSVVGELKTTLAEIEKNMDVYFRAPDVLDPLRDVPNGMSQMRGVLSVLGLDDATQAVLTMRRVVENILMGDASPEQLKEEGIYERLGNNLGALGFLIDMLSYQPALAKKLFVFDSINGELRPLMGRHTESTAEEANEGFLPSTVIMGGSTWGDDVHSTLIPEVEDGEAEQLLAPDDALEVVDAGATAVTEEVLAVTDEQAVDAALLESEVAFEVDTASAPLAPVATAADLHVADFVPAANELNLDASDEALDVSGLDAVAETADVLDESANLPDSESFAESVEVPVVPDASVDQVATDSATAEAATEPVAVAQTEAEDADDDSFDDEIFEIFIEEARDTVGQAKETIEVLRKNPASISDLTNLRRCYHTLKGSGRMVELVEFSEAAWSMEQLFNAWLAESRSANDDLLNLAEQSLTGLGDWIEAIASKNDQGLVAAPYTVSADAMRNENSYIPLELHAGVETQPEQQIAVEEEIATLETVSDESALSVESDVTADFATEVETTLENTTSNAADEVADSVEPESLSAEEVFGEASDFDLDLLESGNAEAAIELPSEGENEVSLDTLDRVEDESNAEFDLGLAVAAAAATTAVATGVSAQEETQSAQVIEPAVVTEDSASELVATDVSEEGKSTEEVSAEIVAEHSIESEPSEAKTLVAEVASTDDVAHTELEAEAEAEAPEADGDDKFKIVGPLRINIPLYNVYVSEADEWSRLLLTSLCEWAMEPHRLIPDDAVAYAHSLAGSSGTVGYLSLSKLARELEHTMERDLHVGSNTFASEHADDYVKVAKEIRRLLQGFAAGDLMDPAPECLELLEIIQAQEPPVMESTMTSFTELDNSMQRMRDAEASAEEDWEAKVDLDAPVADSGFSGVTAAELQESLAPNTEASEIPEVEQTDAVEPVEEEESVSDVSANEPAADSVASDDVAEEQVSVALPTATNDYVATDVASLESMVATTDARPDVADLAQEKTQSIVIGADEQIEALESASVADDGIDVQDVIDEDLFVIFEEEAEELIPELSGGMREWSEDVTNQSARSQVLRVLHTLKGSARLAGALRMGEMAHNLESSIESLGAEGATQDDIEPLLETVDGIVHEFERLRKTVHEEDDAGTPVLQKTVVNPAAQARMEELFGSTVEPEPMVPETTATDAAVNPEPGGQNTGSEERVARSVPQRKLVAVKSKASNQTVRVRSMLLDRILNQTGEVMITRSRLEGGLSQLKTSVSDLTANLERLRRQLRDVEVQAETQMQSRMAQNQEKEKTFDPLEFDRFTRMQELTRMMAESVNDVGTIQRSIQKIVDSTEGDLIAQARQTRDLQHDLLRTRMVEFDSISERLYRVVRQSAKETGKSVRLDVFGGRIEMDRGVLDRMTPVFEHLLRNSVAHGVEEAGKRIQVGKEEIGNVTVSVSQEGNDVAIEFKDDGAGLNLEGIKLKAQAQGLIEDRDTITDQQAANLIFMLGFSTAKDVTRLAGRGVGMDVVRTEVSALGGRVETFTESGKGTTFKLVLPLTTAVTQVVMIKAGDVVIGVPANLLEIVRRATPEQVDAAYKSRQFKHGADNLPFYWMGALLQSSKRSIAEVGKTLSTVVFRSAAQRVAVHVDEVLGNQEVVVKNLGPQLSNMPGLAGMSVLPSGAVVLIYNPVALATVYGSRVDEYIQADKAGVAEPAVVSAVPLVMVVDDSITVRRITQRFLQREGYRVVLAADGLQALEKLADEVPAVVLSDIEMPKMDGFDLLRNIRANEAYNEVPVVMITSRIAEKHKEHAMSLGASHYLGKPYSEEELVSLVRGYTQQAAETAQ